jgi:hypothetical protein
MLKNPLTLVASLSLKLVDFAKKQKLTNKTKKQAKSHTQVDSVKIFCVLL